MIKITKPLVFWGAGILCTILVFISSSDNNFQRTSKAMVKGELHLLYLACKSYWAKTNRTNTCNADIASLTSYGYYKSTSVSIWGESGNESNFTAYGHIQRGGNFVFKLEGIRATNPSRLIFRQLKNDEMESALAKLHKLKYDKQTP